MAPHMAATVLSSSALRRRGKRAGALVKLCQHGFRTVLPNIHLANLRSLPNKTEELLLSQTNKDFLNSAALCFTETWLNDAIPDSALHLPSFQLFRVGMHRSDTQDRYRLRSGHFLRIGYRRDETDPNPILCVYYSVLLLSPTKHYKAP